MELLHQLEQNLSHHQLQSLNLLQLSETELEQFVRAQASDNPVIDIEEYSSAFSDINSKFEEQLAWLRWLQNKDYQNLSYYTVTDDELSQIEFASGRGGFEETLENYLNSQIETLDLKEDTHSLLTFLLGELDEDGYLRESAEELSDICGASTESVRQAIACLQSLEPAGVGAATLKERLLLQLKRRGGSSTAILIVEDHLDDLAHKRFRRIEEELSIDRSTLLKAQAEIQTLDPRVGNHFEHWEDTIYIRPDVYIEEEGGSFTARLAREGHPYFSISNYYLSVYQNTHDSETRSYLKEKLTQAYTLLSFISRREKTILRCAEVLIEKQQDFFAKGTALKPFSMAEAARELGVHPSTVSRTVKNKFVQCPRGVFPFGFFFEKTATASQRKAMGSQAIKTRIQELIRLEDRKDPLSDREINERLAAEGCIISRRTVAKYREELKIPGRAERRQP